MNVEILFAFVAATSVLAISPGPDNIYVLMQSITNGRKYGMATVMGLISGCIIHTTLLAFGVSAIIKNNENIFFIIKLCGASYLTYLAYKVYTSKDVINLSGEEVVKRSTWQLFKQGFIMNVLNPKVTIFFLAFFPGFLFSKELNTVAQFYVLGLLFMFVSFVIFSIIVILSGFISDFFSKNQKMASFFKWLQIIVFVGIAIFLFSSDK
ncbi:LysE family translocator [uncultured Maribacter sp.]|uniref:LysE family translocator n=1 Tax=uncultured Maribacter sp. TaxID=431308 RepID=UPI002609C6A9|nr:LysE family translocator [uncultured Maribacter sp.]